MLHSFCSGELFRRCYRSRAALGAPPSRRRQDKSNHSFPAQTQGAEYGRNKARGYSDSLAGETPAHPGRPHWIAKQLESQFPRRSHPKLCGISRDAGDAGTSSRSGNEADARPPPRPVGLRPAGPLAALLAPYMQPGMAGPPDPVPVACALPAGLGPATKCNLCLLPGPKPVQGSQPAFLTGFLRRLFP